MSNRQARSSIPSIRDAAAVWDIAVPSRPGRMAEAALARRHQAGRAADPEVAFAWAQMVTSRGRVRVEWLAAGAGWSRKHLWSRFGSQIGLPSKRSDRLIRFDHAAHRLAAGHSAALVAAESGYTDQSHLHRDITTLAGVTPTAVAAAPWLAVDDIAWASPAVARSAMVAANTSSRCRIACPWRGLGPGARLTQGMVDEVDVTSGRVVLADSVNADLLAFLRS